MLQILQDLKNGDTKLEEVPEPSSLDGHLLVKTSRSVVSAGTERMLVNFGKANYLSKAKQQPDKVRMVMNKIKTDGVMPTVEAVMSKLEQPLPLGYCNAGVVLESEVSSFMAGDRVISNGPHAELVRVPELLCAKIPDNVDDESAAFTVLASIALQGIRLLKPTIGEVVVVTGLGLIGLIAVQILKANGCKVLGVDFEETKCALARRFGAETVNLGQGQDLLSIANAFSDGYGVDAVLITASTTSNEPMRQAANILRKRGRIVLVGVVGLELSRADLYEKEISFQVSCSYGPGRYDEEYEAKGKDYPIGFVRWTEGRNFRAVLDMMAIGTLNVAPLITHRFEFKESIVAYESLNDPNALGIVLEYSNEHFDLRASEVLLNHSVSEDTFDTAVCGFLGGGNYASRVLIPAFKKADAKLETLITSGGVSSVINGKKHGFNTASTSFSSMSASKSINIAVIATRHNLHCDQTLDCLNQGKNVFVEKPLALTLEELTRIKHCYDNLLSKPRLMVGFNRRFAPQIVKLKSLLDVQVEPAVFLMTVNAGAIPVDHWIQQPEIGGGRIIGEVCHFIDLLRFLAKSPIISFQATKMGKASEGETPDDNVVVTLKFENGALGTINYFSNGDKSFPKERLDVFCNNAIIQLDNFKKMRGFGWRGFKNMNLIRQNKGQYECVKAFVQSVKNGRISPISFEEIYEVSEYSIKVAEALRSNQV
ncbi:bi-domain-containing oxidoreductase [Amylibacter sp.]|nr:bi-domain-containing oxidoreductase [Amylibacter sp.]